MAEETIVQKALKELQYESEQDAIRKAKDIIRKIAGEQDLIQQATIRISKLQSDLKLVSVVEYKI